DPFYQSLIVELENLVVRGKLGRKSGAGFFQYEDTIASAAHEDEVTEQTISPAEIKAMLIRWYLDAVDKLLAKGICTKEELEHIVREYMNAGQSPFLLAKQNDYQFSV
ncbi:MAG: hypothetical protein R2861_17910, partial [Desulfobacterales bacterium]